MFYKKIRQEVLCLVNVQVCRKGMPPPAHAEASLPPMRPAMGQSSIKYFFRAWRGKFKRVVETHKGRERREVVGSNEHVERKGREEWIEGQWERGQNER